MLADSLGRYLADHYPISHRNAVAYSDPWHDPGKWSEMAELGVLHALVPEALGGMGGDGFDIATVFEALGAALCPEPVLGALCAARLIGAVGGDLEPLLSGRVRYAVGFDGDVSANGDTLTGRKSVIYGGASADRILVICNRNGLFELDANSVERTCYGMIDGGNAAEVFLDNTPATRLASDAGELWDVLDKLPEDQRIAVVLRYYGGYRASEIAKITDTPAATVRSHLRRGLTALRKELTT